MDIRYLSRRHYDLAAKSGHREQRQTVDAGQSEDAAHTAQPSTSASTQAAAEATSRRPATLSRFTPAGRLLTVLEAIEERHPEQTKRVLNNIADKLRADAEHAGLFGPRLLRWAERFQDAADSGDMSKLLPRWSPHFGVRAYQRAEQVETDADADATVEHVAGTAQAESDAAVADTTVAPAETADEPVNAERVSGIQERPVIVAESAEGETSEILNPEVTVAESAASEVAASEARNPPVTVAESAKTEVAESDIRNRPITVAESAKTEVAESDVRNRPITVAESAKTEVAESDIRNRPITVAESAKTEVAESDIRNRPITVPESATAASDIRDLSLLETLKPGEPDARNRPVTVPESAKAETGASDLHKAPVTVPESSKRAVNQ